MNPTFRTARTLAALSLLLFIAVPTRADEPPLWSFRDSRTIPDDDALARELATAAAARKRPAAAARGAVGAAAPATAPSPADPSAALEELVRTMEAQLPNLPPDEQIRAQYLKGIADLTAQLQAARKNDRGGTARAPSPSPTTTLPPATPPATSRPAKTAVPDGPDQPVTFEQAIESATRLLHQLAGESALAAFAASDAAKNPAKAQVAAAAAMLLNRPSAALAALLTAHRAQPDNPGHLVNLAGVLCRLGRPREALALLDRADQLLARDRRALGSPMGIDGRALLLNNRGFALLLLGRAADAEAPLREAVRLSPLLAEAHTNLAHALFDLGRAKEAAHFYALGYRRTPVPPGEVPPRPMITDGKGNVAEPGADRPPERRRPAAKIFDLSAGKRGNLPDFKLPRNVPATAALLPIVRKLQREYGARDTEIIARINALEERARKRERSRDVSSAVARRAADIFWAIGHADNEPHLRRLAAERRAAEEVNQLWGDPKHNNLYDDPQLETDLEAAKKWRAAAAAALPPQDLAGLRRVDAEFSARVCAAENAALARWLPIMRRIDKATRDHFAEAYPHQTALAAHLGDPVYNEIARLRIELDANLHFTGMLRHLFPVCTRASLNARHCAEPAKVEDPGAMELDRAGCCPDELKGGTKLKVDLEFCEVSFNCEKVGVEVSTPGWIAAFAEVEVNFDGKVTVFAGVKAEMGIPGGIGAASGAKAGFYGTIDTAGDAHDFGAKGTSSASVNLGPIGVENEAESNISIAAAFN